MNAFGLLLGTLLLALAGAGASAQHLRFAGAQDIVTLDPHQRNDAFTNRLLQQIYEPLISRNATLELTPALAVRWKNQSANVWLVELRQDAVFSDGSAFTADDVIFSIERAQQSHSAMRHNALPLGKASKRSQFSIAFDTGSANPVFPEQLSLIPIMSAAWARAQNCEQLGDPKAKRETACTRKANGTGAMTLKEWIPATRLHLERHANWWGRQLAGLGNLKSATYLPMPNETTRMVALANKEIDLILDPRPNDLPVLVAKGTIQIVKVQENRTVFLGLDQANERLRLQKSNEKNPLKDLRVRQALAHAIDYSSIQEKILRHMAFPTFSMVVPGATGYSPHFEVKPVFDPEKAKTLLAAAGVPNGFPLAMACPSDRHPSDIPVCTAIVAMWSKIGIKTRLQTLPKATYFEALGRADHGFDAYLMSWGGATTDAQFTLLPLVHSRQSKEGGGGGGGDNYGGIANPQIDQLILAASSEMLPDKRHVLLQKALQLHHEQIHHLPLHRQMVLWAASKQVGLLGRADGKLDLARVTLR
jgi:peptide/nickel transport system substrate-binding protein